MLFIGDAPATPLVRRFPRHLGARSRIPENGHFRGFTNPKTGRFLGLLGSCGRRGPPPRKKIFQKSSSAGPGCQISLYFFLGSWGIPNFFCTLYFFGQISSRVHPPRGGGPPATLTRAAKNSAKTTIRSRAAGGSIVLLGGSVPMVTQWSGSVTRTLSGRGTHHPIHPALCHTRIPTTNLPVPPHEHRGAPGAL